jgi:cell division protein FtsI (penicillin-binding protein 3)
MAEWNPRPDPAALRQPSLPGLLRQPARRVLATPAEYALERARTRLVFFALLFVLVFLVIGGRLTFLTLFNQADEMENTEEPTQGNMGRAQIIDRNGVILASSLPTTSACANVKLLEKPAHAAEAIVGVLPELDAKKLTDSFIKRKGCVAIKRHLTPKQYAALNALGYGAIEFSNDEQRMYPQGSLTAHIIGTTDIDNIGTGGIEKKLDTILRTTEQPLQLTLDIRVQHILQHELSMAVNDFQAIGGAGVVMDSQTGAIIAMVSLPDFNPLDIGTAAPEARFNRATLGVYELGSTFKLLTAAQALELGTTKMTDSINTVDPIHIGRHSIKDYHPEHHWLTLPEIIMVSSNIGAARIAEKIGGERQKAFLEQLGMFRPVPIELPEVGWPLIPSNWGEVATMTIGFGHGIAASPLQLVRSVATVSNGGYAITPTLLLDKAKPPPADAIPLLSRATTARMRAMMRLVVVAGTAKAANVDGYQVGGKTGTAEKITNRHYNKIRVYSISSAFYPFRLRAMSSSPCWMNPKARKKPMVLLLAAGLPPPWLGV